MAEWICGAGCSIDVTGKTGPPRGPCQPHSRSYFYPKALGANGRKPLRAVSEKRAAELAAGTAPAATRKPLKRTRRRETPAEREAREHFNTVVKSYPCWFRVTRPCGNCSGAGEVETLLEGDYAKATCAACGGDGRHHCSGERDAHHVIPKQFIRRMFQAVLPEPAFVAILFNPKIGAPLCRYGAHEPIERKQTRIYWEDLSEECIEYVGSLPDFMLIELERQCPKRSAVAA
jgi:hypothetical protein